MTSLSESARAALREALAAAPRGERTATARRLADCYGTSVATVYRLAQVGGAKRARAPARPEYREWTRTAVWIAHRAPKPMPLDLAVEAGIESGLLPAEAAAMPLGTARRLRREMGLAARPKRTRRLVADRPMRAVLADGSTSEHLVVVRELDGGDWLLRLHRAPYPAAGYKNKPLGPGRMRVLAYGVWDMFSGCSRAVYRVGRGEDGIGFAEALCAMLAPTGDPRRPMRGAPDQLWTDQGPGWRHAAVRDLLERLDIEGVVGAPYAKERMGGVERQWRTLWGRFERSLFAAGRDEFRLAEINERLAEHEARMNLRPARTRPPGAARTPSRAEAWTAGVNARPKDDPLRELPPHPVETLCREARRRIDANGIVRWGGVEYECADWHSRRVLARRAADGSGDLSLEDEATGERRPARRHAPRPWGDVRRAPATALARLLAEERAFPGADLHAPGKAGVARGNVVPLPARTAPAAALENPLAGDRLGSVEEAWRVFAAICPWPLSARSRAAVAARFEEAGLDRPAVEALARELSALADAG